MKKIIPVMSIVIMLTVFVLGNLSIYAATPIKYVYTDDAVNIRAGATTESAVIDNVDYKHYEYLGDEPAGNGCSGLWYKIKYTTTQTAYVCSSFAKIVESLLTTTYDRPWTTPKKAIVGGAKFISAGYISKGQHTSYLKKFNVNPASAYPQFTHQYMANLEAPTSEASTTYNSLSANSMLTYDYHFIIPVYLNMPEDTYDAAFRNTFDLQSRDLYKGATTPADAPFETMISTFPDSYKPYLRFLHTLHPNWTFEALNTNLNFDWSVVRQKAVGSIQGWNKREQYTDANLCAFTFEPDTGYCRTEAGWYVANDRAVSFFIDPRNFLNEKYIFMFENLAYSSIYTTTSVQSVVNGTFMSGNSALDNQSYASIFVEAGVAANVSPLYLASLARQESGINIAKTTSGAPFEYKGILYSGLYNFFNIGAYSSEENPALAGLVYANGGVGTTPANPNAPFPVTNYISLLQVVQTGSYINGYGIGTAVSTVKSNVGNQAIVTIKDGNGNVKADSAPLATGDRIQISNSGGSGDYTYVMYGDLNGDGEINSADLLRVRQHLLGTSILSGAYLTSSELTNDGAVNSADLLKIRQHLLGTSSIKQKETL